MVEQRLPCRGQARAAERMACCGWPARALPDILMARPRDMMKAAKMTGAEGKLTRAGNSKFIRSPNLGILLCICWPPGWGSREFQRLPCPRLVYLTLPQAATRVGKCTPWLAPAPRDQRHRQALGGAAGMEGLSEWLPAAPACVASRACGLRALCLPHLGWQAVVHCSFSLLLQLRQA